MFVFLLGKMATTEPYAPTTTVFYDDYYDDEGCDTSKATEFGATFTPVFFSIVVVFSLIGNTLVIVILAKYENLKSLVNAFILNLALSDLLFTAGLPFWAYHYMYGWNLGDIPCKIANFVFSIGFYSSGILLILMTIHRYIAVMKPLSDIMSTTGCYGALASLIIWSVSIVLACPALVFSKVMQGKYCVFESSTGNLWGIYLQNSIFLLSSVVFIFCYSQIICRLVRPTAQRRRNKTLKIIVTLMVVFFVGWAPYNIVIFRQSLYSWQTTAVSAQALIASCQLYKDLQYAFFISRVFAFSHCCLNPVFYVFAGVKFKNHLKKMLKNLGRNRNSIRSRQSRLTIISVTSGEDLSM